ncbi:ribonuclease domain-containing protein [Streptomyces sp. NPDC005925]|uniref:ribonuclease domain-containing protein n=1 Tax=Streptomyces sp. NPDC005925 TaxID=3157172 RepID=UPI0034077A23
MPGEARGAREPVDTGGPFPYRRDGAVLGNAEKPPPDHEWATTGRTRCGRRAPTTAGPGRLVTGRGGEIYYTDDHHRSFRAVLR